MLFLATTLGFSAPSDKIEPFNPDPDAPFTVCQALLSLQAMSGKIVRIRGRWDGYAIHEDCRTQLTTEGYEWPNSIGLSLTTDFAVRKENPAKWFYDESDLEPAYQELMKLRPDPVYATVTGRLDAREPKLLRKEYWSADGRPIGFGDQGYFPARLVIYEITDISNKK